MNKTLLSIWLLLSIPCLGGVVEGTRILYYPRCGHTKKTVDHTYRISIGMEKFECDESEFFFVKSKKKWVSAADLAVGDEVMLKDFDSGLYTRVDAVERVDGAKDVFDIKLCGLKMYNIGNAFVCVRNPYRSPRCDQGYRVEGFEKADGYHELDILKRKVDFHRECGNTVDAKDAQNDYENLLDALRVR